MPNRLAASTSPYLRQHADNPVDWREWGEDAFAEARERDVPVFLSVGYSSCHWCHVMAHESFEDEGTAADMNAAFVNVKVDREERPDVDAVHMRAVQGLTGRGGWPMSVFLTPEGRPFYAGTYWPSEPRHGMPSFRDVIAAITEAWRDRREDVESSAASITDALARVREARPVDDLTAATAAALTADAAATLLTRAWDRTHGGFGPAPKFPQAMTIEWLVARHRRTREDAPLAAAVQALEAMARGGIHDQLAGGFARYATDARWLVPHFERMLYDNALLLAAYAEAAAVTGDARLERTAESTAGALLGAFAAPGGGFVSAFDADTDGVEGATVTWSHDELVAVVDAAGEDGARFAAFLGARPEGNWDGVNILHEPDDRREVARDWGIDDATFEEGFARVRAALLAVRDARPQPGVDDKVLTDDNALAIRALVRAGRALARPDWVAAAVAAADALVEGATVDGRLHHVRSGTRVGVPAFVEDVALLALAELELFAATGERRFIERALARVADAEARFADPDGGWFQTAIDAEELIVRPKATTDNATPAGTSVMVEVLVRLWQLTGEAAHLERALAGAASLAGSVAALPSGHGWLLRQLEALAGGLEEVVVMGPAGPERDLLERTALTAAGPGTLVVVATDDRDADLVALLAGRRAADGRPVAHHCVAMACALPTSDAAVLAAQMGGRAS